MSDPSASVADHAKIPPSTDANRLVAIDWMRGFVMVLMTIDHAAAAFNAGRLSDDSWFMQQPGSELPVVQFFTRWITHLCAPTFVFLAGTALALSFERRRLASVSDRALDRHLFKRALVILAFELLWWGPFFFQVLFAIGMSLICMIPLRRLSSRTLLIIALSILFLYEALFSGILHLAGLAPEMIADVPDVSADDGFRMSVLNALLEKAQNPTWLTVSAPFFHPGILVTFGPGMPLMVMYPFVPWLGMMILGWLLGRFLLHYSAAVAPDAVGRSTNSVERLLVFTGLAAVGLFILLRAWNGYGNMFMLREDSSLLQWLYFSKYPPSLTFASLMLGLMALMLWGLFRYQRTMKGMANPRNPLLVFGQTAFFFYLIHAHILIIAAAVLGMFRNEGLVATYLATLAVLILLYPLCLWFRRFKAARPRSWVRYI